MCPALPRNKEYGLKEVITPFALHLLVCNWNVLSSLGSPVNKNVDKLEQVQWKATEMLMKQPKEQALLSFFLHIPLFSRLIRVFFYLWGND